MISVPPSPSAVSHVLANQYSYNNSLLDVDNVSYDDLERNVIDSLNRGNPIILCERDAIWIAGNFIVGEFNERVDNDFYELPKVGFPMYTELAIETDGSGLKSTVSKYAVMTNHYVTVTGMVKDNNSGRCWIKVQSWGRVYYIDLVEFYNYETPNSLVTTAESTVIVFA